MTPFYTRSGDDGYTSILGKGRVPKYDPQTDAVGDVDEANAALGLARASCRSEKSASILLAIQRDLYHMMAEISARPENAARFRKVDEARLAWLEEQVDRISREISIPDEFIVPGDSPAGAALDLARTVVRRAERKVARLSHQGAIENIILLRYLNRLSSLCFVLEIQENQTYGQSSPTRAKEE